MANDRVSPKAPPTNPLWKWVRRSREEQRRHPERFLVSYPQLKCDADHVWMDEETYEAILRNCGRYDGTLPTGEYVGKMFIRGVHLMWYGIDKRKPMTNRLLHSRQILITSNHGPARRPPA